MAVANYTQLSVTQDRAKRYVGQVDTAQIVNNKHAILESGTVLDGAILARGTGAKVIPFTAANNVFVGIVKRDLSNTNQYNTNEALSYDSATNLDVPFINFGYIVVEAEAAVVKGGSVFVRFGTGTGVTNVIGAIRGDADATGGVGEDEATAVEVPGVIFAESAGAGELVRVAITRIFE
jgi:hypothetical protein